MEDEKAREVLAHLEALEAMRAPWIPFWDELARVVHPRRGIIARSAGPTFSAPDATKPDGFDSTAMRSLRTLANGQCARITPMGARWFGMKPDDERSTPAATSYFHRASETLSQQFRKSNFYAAALEHYLDRGAFGTAATEVRQSRSGGLHFEPYEIGSFAIADNEDGEVDTIARTVWLTPVQILSIYKEKAPESVRKKADDPKSRTIPLEVKRLIRPRSDRDPRKNDERNKPFESFHVLATEKLILAESGFDEFPVAVSRWERWGSSPYGWPPAYMALPEAAQANFLESMLDTLAEVAAFPRVRIPSNLKGEVDFDALGLTSYDPANNQKPEEWLTGGRYDIGKDRLADKRSDIEEAFFVPLFNGISGLGSDATAEQVRALVSESRELFHPILAGLTREFLSPLIRRSFSIALRAGKIPPPPAEILSRDAIGWFLEDPGVEYTSPMALALEQSQLANFADVINTLAPLATLDPSAMDFLDVDAIGPAFFRYKGLPEAFLRSAEARADLREARAAAQQAAQAEQLAGGIQKLGGAQGISDLGALIA